MDTTAPDVRLWAATRMRALRERENLRRLARHYIAQARTLADLAEQLINEIDPTEAERMQTWECPTCGHPSPTFAPKCEGCRRKRPETDPTDKESTR